MALTAGRYYCLLHCSGTAITVAPSVSITVNGFGSTGTATARFSFISAAATASMNFYDIVLDNTGQPPPPIDAIFRFAITSTSTTITGYSVCIWRVQMNNATILSDIRKKRSAEAKIDALLSLLEENQRSTSYVSRIPSRWYDDWEEKDNELSLLPRAQRRIERDKYEQIVRDEKARKKFRDYYEIKDFEELKEYAHFNEDRGPLINLPPNGLERKEPEDDVIVITPPVLMSGDQVSVPVSVGTLPLKALEEKKSVRFHHAPAKGVIGDKLK